MTFELLARFLSSSNILSLWFETTSSWMCFDMSPLNLRSTPLIKHPSFYSSFLLFNPTTCNLLALRSPSHKCFIYLLFWPSSTPSFLPSILNIRRQQREFSFESHARWIGRLTDDITALGSQLHGVEADFAFPLGEISEWILDCQIHERCCYLSTVSMGIPTFNVHTLCSTPICSNLIWPYRRDNISTFAW